jgi:hypothetical protein
MSDQSEINKEELVNYLDTYLFGWAYKQIEAAAIHGPAKLAGFILGACFIDAMASFHAGVDRKTVKIGSGKRFKDFVKKYMREYNSKTLWEDLRCYLVHSYTEGGTYVFTANNQAGFHFDKTPLGKIILNLEDFCADLRKAYSLFRKDILSNKEIFRKAKHRFTSMGLMMEAPVDRI